MIVSELFYWQITEADWERAASEPTDATRDDKAVQKAVQLIARKPGKNQEKCDQTVTPTGLEPVLPA